MALGISSSLLRSSMSVTLPATSCWAWRLNLSNFRASSSSSVSSSFRAGSELMLCFSMTFESSWSESAAPAVWASAAGAAASEAFA
eukprot:13567820-Alexandrium_andersonii.AAC.1